MAAVTAGNSSGAAVCSIRAQFAKFDRLPAELRAALAHSPYDWEVGFLVRAVQSYSVKRALSDLASANAEHVSIAAFALYGPEHPQSPQHIAASTLKAWGYNPRRQQ